MYPLFFVLTCQAGTAGAGDGTVRPVRPTPSKGIMPPRPVIATPPATSDPERSDDHRGDRDSRSSDRRPSGEPRHTGLTKRRSPSSSIDPNKLPSEISVLEIRVGLVQKVCLGGGGSCVASYGSMWCACCDHGKLPPPCRMSQQFGHLLSRQTARVGVVFFRSMTCSTTKDNRPQSPQV